MDSSIEEKKIKLEDFLRQKKIQFIQVIPQKLGQDWSFKVLTPYNSVPGTYFEGSPVVFDKASHFLSKRK